MEEAASVAAGEADSAAAVEADSVAAEVADSGAAGRRIPGRRRRIRGGGGGGFSGGGGGFRRGGGFSGGYRGMPAPRGGGGYVRSGVPGGYRSYAYPGSRSMRPGISNGAGRSIGPSRSSRPANSDGRWNTFAQRGSGPGAATTASEARSGANGGGWQSFSRSRGPAVESGPARGATAPNALAGRNSISQPAALSAIHRSFGGSDFGNIRSGLRSGPRSGLRSGLNAPASASSLVGRSPTARPGRPAAGPATASRNSSSAGSARNRFGSRDFNRFGNFGRFGFHSRFDDDFDDFLFLALLRVLRFRFRRLGFVVSGSAILTSDSARRCGGIRLAWVVWRARLSLRAAVWL